MEINDLRMNDMFVQYSKTLFRSNEDDAKRREEINNCPKHLFLILEKNI